ncbi:MAG TPA: methyltransferase domain-containing protein [Polyangiaceae bacterium]|nr:methyltransferase domain-containing protein [Polyangiaceae bacterium]
MNDAAAKPTNQWAPKLYEDRARFVREGGLPVLDLLAPRAGERILDLGCGPGKLTREIAVRGASVVGVDSSREMLNEARAAYPELQFALERAEALPYEDEFDAIFSNATLHWVRRADEAARAMYRALKRGGRLAVEFGGKGNVATVRHAVSAALGEADWEPWYFPSVGEYASVLERAGFEVRFAHCFARPSPMPDAPEQSGVATWLSLFANELLSAMKPADRATLFARVEGDTRSALYRDGVWYIDYVRLRVEAYKP